MFFIYIFSFNQTVKVLEPVTEKAKSIGRALGGESRPYPFPLMNPEFNVKPTQRGASSSATTSSNHRPIYKTVVPVSPQFIYPSYTNSRRADDSPAVSLVNGSPSGKSNLSIHLSIGVCVCVCVTECCMFCRKLIFLL